MTAALAGKLLWLVTAGERTRSLIFPSRRHDHMTCDNNLTITTQYSNTNVDHYPSVAVVNRPALRIGKVFKNLYVIVFDVSCKVL